MAKGSKSNGLGKRKGSKNRYNLDGGTHRQSIPKLMDFDAKFRKSCGKNVSKNDAVFKFVFLSILGRFGGVWERFGRGLELLSASWATFERHFLVLVFGMVFKSALGGFWARHWVDFTPRSG